MSHKARCSNHMLWVNIFLRECQYLLKLNSNFSLPAAFANIAASIAISFSVVVSSILTPTCSLSSNIADLFHNLMQWFLVYQQLHF